MVEAKEQILLKAFDLFSQYGIKSVSMDDIARNLSVSKRTLYEYFQDKETLLLEGLDYNKKKLETYLEQLEQEPHVAIDVVILLYKELMKHPRWYNRKFYEDLRKYPKATERIEKQKKEFTQKCMNLFNRGVEEGVFLGDVNFEIIALLAKEQTKMLRPSKVFCNHANIEVYNTILYIFLRGLASEKGQTILDRWYVKEKQKSRI